jgi:hypothetical protein
MRNVFRGDIRRIATNGDKAKRNEITTPNNMPSPIDLNERSAVTFMGKKSLKAIGKNC